MSGNTRNKNGKQGRNTSGKNNRTVEKRNVQAKAMEERTELLHEDVSEKNEKEYFTENIIESPAQAPEQMIADEEPDKAEKFANENIGKAEKFANENIGEAEKFTDEVFEEAAKAAGESRERVNKADGKGSGKRVSKTADKGSAKGVSAKGISKVSDKSSAQRVSKASERSSAKTDQTTDRSTAKTSKESANRNERRTSGQSRRESAKAVNKDIKGIGKFGLGHKKTKKSAALYIWEDIGEAFVKAKNWCVTNYRTSIPGAICLVLAVIVVVCLIRNARISRQEEQAASEQAIVTQEAEIQVPDEPLQENAYDYINQFVDKYYNACAAGDVDTYISMRSYTDETEQVRMQKKANYLDYYQNISCYTKPGPIENSYLVYVYYEVKFKDIDTVAPGLNTLYVCTNDDGELYVFSGDTDSYVSKYMQAVSTQQDVKDLFTKVQVTYNDAVDSDETLKALMEELAVNLKNDVGVELAQIEAENASADAADTPEQQNDAEDGSQVQEDTSQESEQNFEQTGEQSSEENKPEEVQAPVTDTVRTTDTVNVRSSASAEATKLGSVSAGTRLTRLEEMANGWSRIDWNGSDGYIKTEYLEVVESASGTVTALANVNVRAEASETADKLGIAYEGSTLELIETQDDGWCRIIFDGQTAYVKSEYVQ